jgi:hypothetical protein
VQHKLAGRRWRNDRQLDGDNLKAPLS